MQDLFREAGISAGAFYLHFSSKDDLIVAIAEDNMHDVLVMIRALTERHTSETVGLVLAAAIATVVRQNESDGLAGLAVQVWAEALINPVVGDRLRGLLDQLHQDLRHIAAEIGHRDAEAMATVFLALLPGLILQLALYGPGSMDGVEGALSGLFAELSSHSQ
jgi:TetR/AcrR family transcriptional regulator, transcriptional repressor of aconitase